MKQVGARGMAPGLIAHALLHRVVLPEVVPRAVVIDHAVRVVIEAGLLSEVKLWTKGLFVKLLFAGDVVRLLEQREGFFGGSPCADGYFLALKLFEAERGIPIDFLLVLREARPVVADRFAID